MKKNAGLTKQAVKTTPILSKLSNKVISLLTLSDVFTWGPYIIVSSLASIYISEKLNGNAVEFLGIGIGVYYFTRASLQIPIGLLSDKIKRDRDELILLTLGSIFMGGSFLFYPLITDASHYYFLQFIFGLGTAINLISWRKLFAQNLDKNKESVEYGFYETIMSISAGVLSILAGVVANISDLYFSVVIVSIGVIMMLGSLWSMLIFGVEKRKSNK